MKIFLVIILGSLLSACATRTLYKPQSESGGYSEGRVNDDVFVSRFSGNAYTHKNDAQLFSQFRSIEVCKEQGFKLARPLGQEDKTSSKTVQRTSNYQTQNPTYFSGSANTNTNYNYYGGNTMYSNSNTNVNGTVYGGGSYGGSSSWEETYTFPTFDTYFSCVNESFQIGVNLKTLTGEEIKEYTKDKLGGVQVLEVANDSPNLNILQVGDIVLKIDNKRVLNDIEFIKHVGNAKNKSKVPAAIVREGENKTVNLKANNITQKLEEINYQVINAACTVQEVKSRPICKQLRGISSTGK